MCASELVDDRESFTVSRGLSINALQVDATHAIFVVELYNLL
jgi:hypothetical protein